MEYGEACYKGVNDLFLCDADEDERSHQSRAKKRREWVSNKKRRTILTYTAAAFQRATRAVTAQLRVREGNEALPVVSPRPGPRGGVWGTHSFLPNFRFFFFQTCCCRKRCRFCLDPEKLEFVLRFLGVQEAALSDRSFEILECL